MNMPQFTTEAALYPGFFSTMRIRRLVQASRQSRIVPATECFEFAGSVYCTSQFPRCPPGSILSGGTCVRLNPCLPGYAFCSSAELDCFGCMNLQTDPNSCGTCCNVCPAGQVCCGGKCGPTSQTCGNCGSGTQTRTCNSAGTAWNAWSACSGAVGCKPNATMSCTNGTQTCNSSCQWGNCVCNSGYTACSNGCKDTQTDSSNCGSCGNKCTTTNPDCCSGSCTNWQTDNQNCGSCGNKCSSTHPNCCSGICTNSLSDSSNCGACNNACPSNSTCVQGKCQCAANSGNLLCNTKTGNPCVKGQYQDCQCINVANSTYCGNCAPTPCPSDSPNCCHCSASDISPDGSTCVCSAQPCSS